MIEKEIKELRDNYTDLLKELSYRLMQTTQVLKMDIPIPEEERKIITELLECATNTLFAASLGDSGDLIDIYKIFQSALIITEHNKDIQAITLKYAPKYPNKITPPKCSHSLSGKGEEFNKITTSLKELAPKIEELRQHKIKEIFYRFKKYHDKT